VNRNARTRNTGSDGAETKLAETRAEEASRVLIIDDEPFHAETVAESLQRVGYECIVASSGEAGAEKIAEEKFDVILTDLKMAGVDGIEILRKARQDQPETAVVVITGHGDVKTAVEAMKQGAANFLQKPVDLVDLRAMVDKAAEAPRLARANRELKRQLDEKFGFEGVIGNSPKMHEVIAKLKSVAPTSATVLIQGETGTGKELVARALHYNSPRRHKPFAAMNCTALNESLLEDELFGHEAGSFTGADRLRKGRFEHANGGTLFLDEVGDMPLSLQAKLLRVLENQEVLRIGSNDPIKVNVRMLSATNHNLEDAVAKGTFRQDLYFRLKVVTVKLPPLRERSEDVPLLADRFREEFAKLHGKRINSISPRIRKAMARYNWPGNVRELRNLIESMVVQDSDGVLDLDDVQEGDTLHRLQLPDTGPPGPGDLVGRPLAEIERYFIEKTLELTGGNREEAASRLGIGERTLYRVIQDWKAQDQIKAALAQANGSLETAATALGMTMPQLQRKIKKLGIR
jgi:two-component system, NtrC family, response regulator HydG